MSGNKKPFGPAYRDAVMTLAVARGGKGAKLNVLRAILTFCNGTTGQAFPGNKKIMDRAGVTSKGTLDIALRWLKQNGIIKPIAYETGGYGRAVVWGFGLPAHSTPETVKTSLKNGELDFEKNLPENRQLPPRKSSTTSPKIGEPTELTKLTGDEDTPRRREHGHKGKGARTPEENRLFDQWLAETQNYGEARRLLDEWRDAQAMQVEQPAIAAE